MDGRMFLLFKDSDRFIENKKGAVACPPSSCKDDYLLK